MNELLSFIQDRLLGGLIPTVHRVHTDEFSLSVPTFTPAAGDNTDSTSGGDAGGGAKGGGASGGESGCWTFETDSRLQSFSVSALTQGRSAVLSLDARLDRGNTKLGAFASYEAVNFRLGDLVPDALVGSHRDNPWWMLPSFVKTYEELPATTQSLLIRSGTSHIHLLPLTGDNFRAEIREGILSVTSDMAGLRSLQGPFLAVTVAEDPFTAIRENYAYARRTGALRVPLRQERTLPALFDGFGFCTWNCFYTEVSSAGVFQKLDEFRSKGIPVRWLLLDDGWMSTRDNRLTAFEVNDQFPEGLKAFTDKVKADYGIEHIGVWHAFDGYWDGIDPESPLCQQYKDCLQQVPSGFVIPALEEEKAFRFWDDWYTYLESCGIDFVKVDNQSSYSIITEGAMPTAEACRIAHRALERAVYQHFGGAIINCMGQDMENVLARPASCVSRNSDDFFPKNYRGFVKHLVQNAWNAMTHSQLYVCDFDMWWSSHESAFQNGVLRAIAGSPIYVSDRVGESAADKILASVEDDGRVMWMDGTAQPTPDIVYTDCVSEHRFLKVWNTKGRNLALAVYNVSDAPITEELSFADIPGFTGSYVAYEYFSKAFIPVDASTRLSVTLPVDEVQAWSLYAVEGEGENAFISLGQTDKFFGIASAKKEKKWLSELSL